MSDYIETLSLSSHSSSDTNNENQRWATCAPRTRSLNTTRVRDLSVDSVCYNVVLFSCCRPSSAVAQVRSAGQNYAETAFRQGIPSNRIVFGRRLKGERHDSVLYLSKTPRHLPAYTLLLLWHTWNRPQLGDVFAAVSRNGVQASYILREQRLVTLDRVSHHRPRKPSTRRFWTNQSFHFDLNKFE